MIVIMNKIISSAKNNRNPALMPSLDPNLTEKLRPSLTTDSLSEAVAQEFQSLDLTDNTLGQNDGKSILLIDDNETLCVNSPEAFQRLLKIPPNEKVKVVSIFGNTGEGKSYTLNRIFFNGEEVFKTSSSQFSCTIGVWAKYDRNTKVICLDTEGLLGISTKENQRKRLLLKVLAISDIVIYRTRSGRVQQLDMYTFLGGASKAYKEHFSEALTKALKKNDAEKYANTIGPGVIIFHETKDTETLHDTSSVTESPEDIIQETFGTLNLSCDSFSFLKYVGVRTKNGETSFKELKQALMDKLDSTEIRSRRDAKFIYLTLKSINDKFQNQLGSNPPQLYLPTFFTCPEKCQSCKNGCRLSMGHFEEGEPHQSDKNCIFQHQYQNFIYLCKNCYQRGERTVVKEDYQTTTESRWIDYFNYVWSGYVIVCPVHGEIYRSRKHWYGNKDPEDAAVRTEIVHIWPGDRSFFGSQNSAQKVLDGVTMVSEVIASVGSQPTKAVAEWATDKIRPSYWRSDDEIKECFKCKEVFPPKEKKHHCRSCGEGFCDACSSKRQPVPIRGWYDDVRVCDDCYQEEPPSFSNATDGSENRARQIGETVFSIMSTVKTVLDIPKDFIKNTARPTYWTPDNECIKCIVCSRLFGPMLQLHHCRDCGKGVCDDCSTTRKPVPLRGWESPVRVCDQCTC